MGRYECMYVCSSGYGCGHRLTVYDERSRILLDRGPVTCVKCGLEMRLGSQIDRLKLLKPLGKPTFRKGKFNSAQLPLFPE